MPKGRSADPQILERMRQLREQGKTNKEIADECGLPYKTVCNVLYNRLGPKKIPQHTPPEVIEKIKALRAQGKKITEVAEECGVSEVTVKRYLLDDTAPAREPAAVEAPAPATRPTPHPHTCDSNPNAATPPRPLLSIRERGPGGRLRGLLVGAGEMVAALGGQVEVVVSVRRVEG